MAESERLPNSLDRSVPHWSTVLQDLKRRDLASLAQYLRRSKGEIDPCIAAYLIKLIDGTPLDTGNRLKIVQHPVIKKKSGGKEKWFLKRRRDRTIARAYARHRFEQGKDHANALFETSQKFKCSPKTVEAIWTEAGDYRDFVKARALAFKNMKLSR